MVELYSNKVCELSEKSSMDSVKGSVSYLKNKDKEVLMLLINRNMNEFTPIKISKTLKVTNKTIINRLSVLVNNGFVVPVMVNQRIRSYKLSDFTIRNKKEILNLLK